MNIKAKFKKYLDSITEIADVSGERESDYTAGAKMARKQTLEEIVLKKTVSEKLVFIVNELNKCRGAY